MHQVEQVRVQKHTKKKKKKKQNKKKKSVEENWIQKRKRANERGGTHQAIIIEDKSLNGRKWSNHLQKSKYL